MAECSGSPDASAATTAGLPPNLHTALEPALIDACDGRLRDVEWFRTNWQASGSSTGYALLDTPSGPEEVVVKMPVGEQEHAWTVGLGAAAAENGPTPRVFASGDVLGAHAVRWFVCERCPGQPISHGISRESVEALLEATADWYVAAGHVRAPADPPDGPDWAQLLHKSRDFLRDSRPAHAQRWNSAVHAVEKILDRLVAKWETRPITTWCHGDLHPGNAMRRASGQCMLLDLSLVHAGHWVEDAVYLERLFWGHSEKLEGLKPTKHLAKLMRERKAVHGEDHAGLANTRRVLMAACVPAFAAREWSPAYANGALALLERLMPLVNSRV